MDQLLTPFALGTAAILTNACLLPLYPGLIAFLAGNAGASRSRLTTGLLGVVVLAGILTAMLLIGAILYGLQAAFNSVLPVLLPILYGVIIYGVIIVLGVLLLLGHSPFARIHQAQTPILKHPVAAAYLYGLLLGPMTLPCTGPIITSAFLLSATGTQSLADGLLYFLLFGLGFGWPLVVLPLLTLPFGRQITRVLARHKGALDRASGVLLIAVGMFGVLTELMPRLAPGVELSPQSWALYWVITTLAVFAVGAGTWHRERASGGR